MTVAGTNNPDDNNIENTVQVDLGQEHKVTRKISALYRQILPVSCKMGVNISLKPSVYSELLYSYFSAAARIRITD